MKIVHTFFSILILLSLISSCGENTVNGSMNSKSSDYQEKHRPQYHFSPESGWMNDPNGMVYFEGEYHLFYQHYPDSTVWGPMHWGHAISKDLIHWEHFPIALFPDKHGLIFSGSAVVDWNNTSGFGENGRPPLVAIFTYHDMEKEQKGEEDDYQTQGIAYSNDKGRTWQKYDGNPVLLNPGIRDFRDPKVIWHEESETWVMALAVIDHLNFYGSKDLKKWEFLSQFGKELGSHDGVWECPDLFPMAASDTGKEYWVLIENMNPGNPNGGSGTQYFIGQFDGVDFTVDDNFMNLLSTTDAKIPNGRVFDDFEGGYGNWSLEGDAFGTEPAKGSLEKQNQVSGFTGAGLVNSFYGGDEKKGRMTSKPFKIDTKAINFLIGGGNHRGRTYIGLLIDGEIVRQSEGKSSEQLEWKGWNVEPFIGSEAQIVIVDNYSGGWGHISVDEITFADKVAVPAQSSSVWLDAGPDNYAGVTWSDVPDSDGRRIFIGWMSNWAYAQVVPTDKWRSANTIPWKLSIEHVDGIPRLIGSPVEELNALASGDWEVVNLVDEKAELPKSGMYEFDFEFSSASTGELGFEMSNDLGQKISFTLDQGVLSFDRRYSSDNTFSNDFPRIHSVERIGKGSGLKVHGFVDHSSIEIFIDDGKNIFTELFFPEELYSTLKIVKEEGQEFAGSIRELKGIWK